MSIYLDHAATTPLRAEVLDRLDADPVAADRGRVVRVDDALRQRGDRIAVAAIPEDDSGVGRGRGERDLDPLTRVKPHTFEHDRLPDGLLANHDPLYRHVRCHKMESIIMRNKPVTYG